MAAFRVDVVFRRFALFFTAVLIGAVFFAAGVIFRLALGIG
jgi:hypothetical protein